MRVNVVSVRWWQFAITSMLVLFVSLPVSAQSTISTGAITGAVTDPSGAGAGGVDVIVRSAKDGRSLTFSTTEIGLYSSGPIAPGDYTITLDVKGFATVQVPAMVLVGTTTSVNVRLQPAVSDKKTYNAARINSAEATVQGVITSKQLEDLPLNGRNFLDAAQLEPGVQIRDAAQLDSTKSGFFAISTQSDSGRSTRTEVDGIDFTDERVGTSIQNFALSSIAEFQVAQSSLDISSPMTSGGEINVVTRSGSNDYHGGAFYGFRDSNLGFATFPGGRKSYFQRNQFGGNFGGALIKDKLFFFLNGERTKQDSGNFPALDYPFNGLGASYRAPFRDNTLVGRFDWTGQNFKAFYRGAYNNISSTGPGDSYSPYLARDNSPAHIIGADFYRGSLTQSVRAGYTRYSNHLGAAAAPIIFSGFPNISIENVGIKAGPTSLGQKSIAESSIQIRYDATRVWSNHIFRFGASYDRVATGGYETVKTTVTESATFANEQAILGNPTSYAPALVAGDPAGALDNPLNYPVGSIIVSNGQKFSTEKSGLGYPGGGLIDNRLEFYVGDAWKAKRNLTINYGLHYLRDGGLTNSDLPGITALNGFAPTLGGAVHQPNLNFSPELGITWAPFSGERTIFRAGAGLYYDSNLAENVVTDRALRLQQGQYAAQQTLCGPGQYALAVPGGTLLTTSDGLNIATQICGHALSDVINGVSVSKAITDLQSAIQSTSAVSGANAFYAGTTGSTLGSMLSANYVSPRSLEMNVGLQHQFGRSTVLSLDYVRNMGTHFLLGVDRNHVGDVNNFNLNNALAAVNRTLAANAPSCGQVNASTSIAGVTCYLRQVRGASISDFAVQGLDSSGTFANSNAAFGGTNPNLGQGIFYEPIGNSRYRAVDVSLRSAVQRPVRGVQTMNVQVAYSWSKFQSNFAEGNGSTAGQGGFTNASDWNSPNRAFGPSGLDRTHQFTFGPMLALQRGFQLSIVGHLDSPLPLTIFLPQLNGGGTPGEIFRSDVNGDGTVGDIVSGSNIGSVRSGSSVTGLNFLINNYNSSIANRLTPAGAVLVTNGLFTQTQLLQLGATTPQLANAPTNAEPGWLKTVDLRLSWPHVFRERFTVEPSVSAFNIFNFANFDSLLNPSSGILEPATAFLTNGGLGLGCGTANTCRASTRIGQGSGVFSLGSARQLEFRLRITF